MKIKIIYVDIYLFWQCIVYYLNKVISVDPQVNNYCIIYHGWTLRATTPL